MSKKTIWKIILTALVAAATAVLTLLETSCTALIVTQKTPNKSEQSVTVTTSVDSTQISMKPPFKE